MNWEIHVLKKGRWALSSTCIELPQTNENNTTQASRAHTCSRRLLEGFPSLNRNNYIAFHIKTSFKTVKTGEQMSF